MSSQTSQLVKHIRSRASHRHRPVSSRLITSVYIILGALSCPRPGRWLITFVYIILIPAPRSMADQTSGGLPPVELFVRVTCSETQSRETASRTVRPTAGKQPHGHSDPQQRTNLADSQTQSRGTTSRTVRPRVGEQPRGQSDPEQWTNITDSQTQRQ